MLVSGSYEPPGQFVPPPADASISVASGPSALLTTGGVKIGPILYREIDLHAFGAKLGREVDEIVDDESLPVVVERLAASVERKRLRRRVLLARAHHLSEPGRSSIGHNGCPVTRSNTYRNACLVGCATALMIFPSRLMSTRIGAHGMS